MKRIVIFALSLIALTACTDTADVSTLNADTETQVTLTFAPYDVVPITRTDASIATVATSLDVWLITGADTTTIHQTTADVQFGSISLTLNRTKTYQLIAVAHKSTAEATLVNGTTITFPDNKTTHSMVYTTTFSPADTPTLSCLMTRIVAQFRLETADAVPAACKKIQITISNVYDCWHITDGGTTLADHTHTINITSTAQDGTVALNVFAIVAGAQTLHTVTIAPLDADNNPVQTPHTFTDVPLRNGYRTTYHGQVFTDTPTTATFTVEDWNAYDTVNF